MTNTTTNTATKTSSYLDGATRAANHIALLMIPRLAAAVAQYDAGDKHPLVRQLDLIEKAFAAVTTVEGLLTREESAQLVGILDGVDVGA